MQKPQRTRSISQTSAIRAAPTALDHLAARILIAAQDPTTKNVGELLEQIFGHEGDMAAAAALAYWALSELGEATEPAMVNGVAESLMRLLA